jgi:hypothetical protein
MRYYLTCLECKNDIDLKKYEDVLNKFNNKKLSEDTDIIIECNHCATDHLVDSINKDGEIKAEIIERDK